MLGESESLPNRLEKYGNAECSRYCTSILEQDGERDGAGSIREVSSACNAAPFQHGV